MDPRGGEAVELASTLPRRSNAVFGAHVFGPHDPGADLARAVESAVFEQAFGNTAEVLAAEYGPFEPASLFVAVLDHRRRLPMASARLILPVQGGPGLKSALDLAPAWCSDPAELLAEHGLADAGPSTLDWATLAILPEYRSATVGLVQLAVFQTVVTVTRALQASHLLAIVDRSVHVMSRLRYAQPFVPFAEARPYLGSPASIPVYLPLAAWEERLRLVDPVMHDVIFERRHLDPALDAVDPATAGRVAAAVMGGLELSR